MGPKEVPRHREDAMSRGDRVCITRSLAWILYKTEAEVKGCFCEEEGAHGELQTRVKGELEVVLSFLKGSCFQLPSIMLLG